MRSAARSARSLVSASKALSRLRSTARISIRRMNIISIYRFDRWLRISDGIGKQPDQESPPMPQDTAPRLSHVGLYVHDVPRDD
jgi:hypothetical protein